MANGLPPETDVVVVGSGMAGLAAALSAAELGLRVTLLEKSTLDPSWSNSRISNGAVHPCMIDIKSPPETIVERLIAITDGVTRSDLARAFAADSLPALEWLQSHGVQFVKAGPYPHLQYVFAPPGRNRAGLEWEGRGSDLTLRRLKTAFVEQGGAYRNGCQVTDLQLSDGRVTGVVAQTSEGTATLRSPAVVLADGGFQASRELMDRYFGPGVFDRIKLRGADTGTGDGLRMAQAVGAKLVNLDRFYGHCLSLDAIHEERLWPYPMMDALIGASILVWRRTGRRFLDEGAGGVNIANLVARGADPQDAIVVLDDAIWNGPGTELVVAPNPNLVLSGGRVYSADTLDELATRAGVDPAGLRETVAEYNRAIADGRAGLTPPRTGRTFPIERPPFHAVPIVPGITYTMGGILVDADARVLNEREEPIPGLWAAGVTAGGLEGGPRAGYAGGLLQSVVFGRRAAASVARTVGAPAAGRAPLARPAATASPAATAKARTKPYPALRLLIQHGGKLSAVAAATTAVLALATADRKPGAATVLRAVGLAAAVGLGVKNLAELNEIIADTLLPE